jgi:hypothetical protein
MSLSASHTALSQGSVADVWRLWSHVEDWPKWDSSIETSTLQPDSAFGLNGACVVSLKGTPDPITLRITDYVLHKSFTTKSTSPLGTVSLAHELAPLENGTQITHTATFDATNAHTQQIFETTVWTGLTQGLTAAVNSLAQLAVPKKKKRELEESKTAEPAQEKTNKTASLSTSYTAFSKGSVADVWARWSDVANWSKWDMSLRISSLKGFQPFQQGSTCVLVTHGNPNPIDALITELTPNASYTTTSQTDLGVVAIHHKVCATDGGVHITHTATFEPKNEEMKHIFESKIWPQLSQGLNASVERLAEVSQPT